ncbi:MAG: glycosyl hydrolase 53 family protein [Muribaculaceae bacterium]|nr:glycosyl hydrolase 53 family protein [Muribaculaceae bacterium]
MKKLFFSLALIAFLNVLNSEAKRPEHLWLGGDISGTTSDEARGIFSADTTGKVTENTQLMKNYGMNAVRLRVWVNPKDGWSSKEDVLTMAKRAKDLGMEIMIDFHYSDWWADPGKQNIPAAWVDYDLPQMKEALANHTKETLQLLKDNDINVKWVQVGNETRDGMLWPMGQISKGNFKNYAELSQAGYDAIKEIYPDAKVIVHIDNGYDNEVYNYIFDGLKENNSQWDIIGMSVYPYWAMDAGKEPDAESTLRDAADNIRKLKAKYGSEIMITEVGVESEKPEEGEAIMNQLFDLVINDVEGACTAVFYWAPEMFQTTDFYGNKHGYALGAFQNARPTKIMNSFKRASEIMKQEK